ncbi:endonuclease/exonuclease/phosphatase family protein [Halopseudomonas phragmitis]|uniref:Endonuclease n=2 Tax=Pseudomonadaceae TaxID=135621 RepID=A0A1V0B9V0_9GAMM|nr:MULTISPECIES: endonuclease/exonuclease/phosphatase family protein [Pseudomonadaceae]AQZ96705.1 endonuclease [Halopseudomonas phragmitis]PAU86843.1 endonuclease [Pseudomonas sp. WN033]RHW20654.1 endonuclease [Pseudomonas jilinensis]
MLAATNVPWRRVTHGHALPAELRTNPHCPCEGQPLPEVLKLLSFNIQVGINTQRYHHYLTKSWQHLLPHAGRQNTLRQIAQLLSEFDLVALQEVDGGSLRSGYVNQVEHLAKESQFPYWYQQLNRNLGRFAQHSNGLLSRFAPKLVEDHKLPGMLPGRGAILTRFGQGDEQLLVVMMHLALSTRTRASQLAYIRERISDFKHVVLMGDMNTHAIDLLEHSPLRGSGLHTASLPGTYPSWKPARVLDHILLSSSLDIEQVDVLPQAISDHLPVAMHIRLPDSLRHA